MWHVRGSPKTQNSSWNSSKAGQKGLVVPLRNPRMHTSASVAEPYAWDLTLQPPPRPQESADSLLSLSGLLGPIWIRWCLLQHSKYVLYLCCFHLMLINFGSYKNPTCLIWCSDSYFPKKTTAAPQMWMSYMWYQWLMQHHVISSLVTKIISRI